MNKKQNTTEIIENNTVKQKTKTEKKNTEKKTATKKTTEKKATDKKPTAKKTATAKKTVSKSLSSRKTTVKKTVTTKTDDVKTENIKQEVIDIPVTNEAKETQAVITVNEFEHPKTENTENTLPIPTEQETLEQSKTKQEIKVPTLPNITITNIIELSQAPLRNIVLTDQQIQTLTLDEIEKRHKFLQHTLANILDYDIVISDTNIWLELLIGHTSSHSDPRINARLQFERQLEFISKLTKYRGGHFMMMSETYEEIDRFATMQDPTNHKEADFTDNIVYLNAAARLAKRLILSQQRENRLHIANIGAESHHASFADPAIIKCVADYFSQGKKVLLLTNDTSVAIRSMGICDDLQRHNNISDEIWNEKYVSLRPMVFTFEDLKLLDFYTRQYHYIQMASGQPWMSEISKTVNRPSVEPLTLWMDAFRPGDKHKGDNLFTESEQKQITQKQQKQQKNNPSRQQKNSTERTNVVKTEEKKDGEVIEKAVETPKESNTTDTTKKNPTKAIRPQRRKPQSKKQAKNEEKTA